MRRKFDVGVNAWGTWEPWGLPMAFGMALDRLASDPPWSRGRWSARSLDEHLAKERRLPDNKFIQNARLADALVTLHMLGCAMPVHDRPMRFARMTGAYERPAGGRVQPHALWALCRG